jgi:hypothetical protein
MVRSSKKGGHVRVRPRDGGMGLAFKARIARYLEAYGYAREAASNEASKYSGHSGRIGIVHGGVRGWHRHRGRCGACPAHVAERRA